MMMFLVDAHRVLTIKRNEYKKIALHTDDCRRAPNVLQFKHQDEKSSERLIA